MNDMRKASTFIATRTLRRFFGFTVLAVVSLGWAGIAAHSQELTTGEQSPQLDQLAPAERDITEDSLRYGAQLALTSWQELRADPQSGSFDAYFDIFKEVARIESLVHATKIAGVAINSKLAIKAAELRAQLHNQGLSAREAGVMALKTLISSSDQALSTADPDAFKVRYTLILDYISDLDVAKISLDLAKRLSTAKLNDLALDIYADFLPLYYDGLVSAVERQELLELAGKNAHAVADPAVFRVLTDLLRRSPRAEKVQLAQATFGQIDPDFIRAARDASLPSGRLVLSAWLHGVETAHGAKREDDFDDLRVQARNSLDGRAFELLVLSVKDAAQRNRMVANEVMLDVADGRPLIGYDRAINLALPPQAAVECYLSLIRSFAAGGYDNYVRSLAELVASSVKAGNLSLSPQQTEDLFASIEVIRDPAFILTLADAMPDVIRLAERTAMRADIRSVFSMPVDEPIGATSVHSTAAATKALEVAANLINGEQSDVALLAKLEPSRGRDVALLSDVATRLWQYTSRRDALLNFLRSGADADLRQAVALGVTAFAGFNPGHGIGAEFVGAIGDLLPATTPEGHALLAASIGRVADPRQLRGEALGLHARYIAAMGQSLVPLGGVAEDEKTSIAEASATFGNVDVATARLKTIADYRTRVAAFRRLAVARSSVLDKKGWLNSAIAPQSSGPYTINFGGTAGVSDGRIALSSSENASLPSAGRPFMPNLLLGQQSVTSQIPVPPPRDANEALADISKRGETRATRLIRFSSEHFEEIINLGVREYLYLNSESTVPRIIFVTRGVLTMSELIAQVTATDPDAITLDGDVVTLNVPLAINDGAALIVSGQEIKSLRMNTKAGAFIVNSGKIYFDDVSVSSIDVSTGKPSYVYDHDKGIFFRPFILSWSGSETYASNSQFVALGYAGGRTYGMSLSSGSTDTQSRKVQAAAPTGYFVNNSFENLYYGFYAFEAKDIVFVGNELVNGVIYGLDPHDRSANMMMAYNTAYGTKKKHGIIISREVDDSFILGNLSFENHGSGIMLDRLSFGTIVYANDASRNDGDGFSAMESPCALVDSNSFYNNGRSGVKVRNSWDVHVEGNQIRDNKAAGIEAYIDNLQRAEQSEFRDFEEDPYYPIATVAARDNVIAHNRVGLMTRGASEAMFYANRFIDQLPRYVSGDLKPLALDVVTRNMKSGVLVRSVCVPKIPVNKLCSLAQDGVIIPQSLQPEFTAEDASTNYCTDVVGSPQAAAFNSHDGE
jgi:hypothetical protein